MSQATALLGKANLKQLRRPTMSAAYEELAREAAAHNGPSETYPLRLTEAGVATRSANAPAARRRAAAFPVAKDFDTYDFTARPGRPKQEVLELARGAWVAPHDNGCLIGNAGTGKTQPAIALGLAACRQGKRALLHRGGAGEPAGGGPATAPPGTLPGPTGTYRPGDRRRAGLPVLPPHGGRTALPGVRRPLRAPPPADHQRPGVRGVGPGVPGGADAGGLTGSVDAPLPYLRDERRK